MQATEQSKPAEAQSFLTDELERGGAGEIPPAEEKCPMDEFENHIRRIGVVCACEWFGHDRDSEFTKETIRMLIERSNTPAKGIETA